MDINLNNIGINGGMIGANNTVALGKAPDKPRADGVAASLTIGMRADGITSCEPVANVPDAELTRDDDLGKRVGLAFNLPPPAMPDFN